MSQSLLRRIARKSFYDKIRTPAECVQFFKDGMSIGFSGFSPAGYPKVVPLAVADHVEKNKLEGKMRFHLFAGASLGSEVEDRWADLGMTISRWPYQSGPHLRKHINDGTIEMGDIHLSVFAQNFEFGFFTKEDPEGMLDVGVIEATEILPNGGIVCGAGIGIAPEIADRSRNLIIEVNTSIPSYKGLHDVFPDMIPPHRKPFLIQRTDDRIGEEYIAVDPDKVVAIVESQMPDNGLGFSPPDDMSKQIAGNLLDFFENEVKAKRMPPNLLPLQSGVGNIANAVITGFVDGPFEHLTVWTEVAQDSMLDFLDSGKLDFLSTAAMSLSPEGFERFYGKFAEYSKKIIIRPQHTTNHPEVIRRLGVIGMNTPVELDIYGHANSTLINGTGMIHGIGGSGDFLRSGYVAVMHTPSARRTKTDPTGISCIVPKVAHVDHTEHDLDVIVTEQGLADLRGLAPRKRAREVIAKCAHPDFKDQLNSYLDIAEKECLARHAGHEPQLLDKVFKMHLNLQNNGTMKLDSW